MLEPFFKQSKYQTEIRAITVHLTSVCSLHESVTAPYLYGSMSEGKIADLTAMIHELTESSSRLVAEIQNLENEVAQNQEALGKVTTVIATTCIVTLSWV